MKFANEKSIYAGMIVRTDEGGETKLLTTIPIFVLAINKQQAAVNIVAKYTQLKGHSRYDVETDQCLVSELQYT